MDVICFEGTKSPEDVVREETNRWSSKDTGISTRLGCMVSEHNTSRNPELAWVVTILCWIEPGTVYCIGTEASVGRAIKESGVLREEIFITTKLSLVQTFSSTLLAIIGR